jgi:hypothetical protein
MGSPETAARLMTPTRRFASVGACLNSSTVSNWIGHLRGSKEWLHEACVQRVARLFGHARKEIVCDPRVSARRISFVVGVLVGVDRMTWLRFYYDCERHQSGAMNMPIQFKAKRAGRW